jgi:hypothetical protein
MDYDLDHRSCQRCCAHLVAAVKACSAPAALKRLTVYVTDTSATVDAFKLGIMRAVGANSNFDRLRKISWGNRRKERLIKEGGLVPEPVVHHPTADELAQKAHLEYCERYGNHDYDPTYENFTRGIFTPTGPLVFHPEPQQHVPTRSPPALRARRPSAVGLDAFYNCSSELSTEQPLFAYATPEEHELALQREIEEKETERGKEQEELESRIKQI